jgi:hypothetical protein
MAYIKGFTYDIFISYSHLDNLRIFDEAHGWIEEFYNDLNILLSRRIGVTDAVKIWWDSKKLDGSVLFDQSIEDSINQSAILLCLTSPGYLKSEYCQKELELFYTKAQKEPTGLSIDNRSRIINVLLNNIPHAKWPKELSGTTGFPFHDAKDSQSYGDTLDVGSEQFKNDLKDLREAIVKLMDAFPTEPVVQAPEKKFTIYFGDVADSLRTIQKRTITELAKQDFNLIYGIPPPFEEAEHEIAVKEKLAESNLTVHLLDQFPGRNIEGEETIWYPQKQAELGLESSKQQLIWVPAEINIETIEEESYKTFLQGLDSGKQSSKNIKYIRGIKSELTQQIADIAKNIQAQWAQPEKGKVSVLLDTHYDDQLYALELSKKLIEIQIQPFINPQEDDPKKNINILGDRISQVNKLIFFYGKVSRDWVIERMKAALQLIVSNNYPKKDFFLFMVPPHKDPDDISLKQQFIKVNVINNSDALQLDFNALLPFFNSIKAVA